jgi:predicted Fe-S protein YdhL (DUF1289 family)
VTPAPASTGTVVPSRLNNAGLLAAGIIVVAGGLAAVKVRARRRTCTTCGITTADPGRLCEGCRRKAADAALWATAAQEERQRAQADAQREARERRDRAAPDIFDPYAVLGVPRTATKDEIRAAYKEAMTKYHPDKVAHLGEDLQTVAREKALALNHAYRLLN